MYKSLEKNDKFAKRNKHSSPAPVILGPVPRILLQQGSNLVNKLALLLHKCWELLLSAFCKFFKYPSPDAKASPSPARDEGYGLLRSARNDVCSAGRSMIEMLGVLAIVAILTVGGIAGYNKAMEKYKLNKVMTEYSMLVYGILEHIDDFRKYRTQNDVALSNVLEALGVIPSSWHRDDKNDFIDDNGYTIRVFNHYGDDYDGTMTIDFYLGGYSFNDKGSMTTAGSFPSKVCAEIINNIAVPLHSIMLNVWMYGANYNFYGSSYCGGGKKCLKDVTPAEAQEACSVCAKHSYCALVFYF